MEIYLKNTFLPTVDYLPYRRKIPYDILRNEILEIQQMFCPEMNANEVRKHTNKLFSNRYEQYAYDKGKGIYKYDEYRVFPIVASNEAYASKHILSALISKPHFVLLIFVHPKNMFYLNEYERFLEKIIVLQAYDIIDFGIIALQLPFRESPFKILPDGILENFE